MDKRKNNGGHSTKPIRDTDLRLVAKTDLQAIHERLEPFTEEAISKHAQAIKEGEKWAIELFYKYRYGMPKQVIDQNNTHTINDFDIKDIVKFE
jgi:hypothetical protein